jgi:DNA-binding HxlR family transcriptional regulator
MLFNPFDPNCPSGRALDLISSKWTSLVVMSLSEGIKRYSDIQREIPTVSHKMLTQTLRRLEMRGLIQRTVYAEVPPRVEYALTEMGQTLVPPIKAVLSWAETYADELRRDENDPLPERVQ